MKKQPQKSVLSPEWMQFYDLCREVAAEVRRKRAEKAAAKNEPKAA